jgi:hypothetical protein
MFKPLDRRTFLKAAGVSLALPLLESMSPAIASAATAAPPKRMVTICNTLGLHPPSFWPKTTGPDYELTEYLELVKEHRNNFTLINGLAHEDQTGGTCPHSCEMTWLTSARNPGTGNFKNSVSFDQVAAEKLGYVTRFPSVSLSSWEEKGLSVSNSGVMIPAESHPARLFSQLFLQGNAREVELQKENMSSGRSILDAVMSRTKSLHRRISAGDKEQLDTYFEAVRKAEKDISKAESWLDTPKPVVHSEPPVEFPNKANLIERTQLLMDMTSLIFQTDSSRLVTILIDRDHGSVKVDGVTGSHHVLSHHGKDPAKIIELRKIEVKLMETFNDFLTQLTENNEGETSLLDNTMVLFGSNLGNGNSHDPHNLPLLLAGGGFDHGTYIKHDENNNEPLCNLFVTMMNNMGIETESFAQSTGALSWLGSDVSRKLIRSMDIRLF